MDVLGIDVTAAEAGAAYPAEVVGLAADLAGYEGDDPEIAVAVCSRPAPPPAPRRCGPWPTASATAWPTSAS